jgi:hypothetical protein
VSQGEYKEMRLAHGGAGGDGVQERELEMAADDTERHCSRADNYSSLQLLAKTTILVIV